MFHTKTFMQKIEKYEMMINYLLSFWNFSLFSYS